VQMAYLKAWAPRAYRPLELRAPIVPDGPPGRALRADACDAVHHLPAVDLAYLDPPYNQHRYTANYHVWETIVAGDAPAHYGVACKRVDLRGPDDRSAFNERARMPGALASCVKLVNAGVVVLSYNDEAWISLDELVEMCAARGPVTVLSFDSRRYVGATIGIHNPAGEKVGTVSHTRNTEYVLVAGELSKSQRRRLRGLVPIR
jgi:adenine-specific DNA-methyltransferase